MWTPDLARELAPKLRSLVPKELGWDRRRWRDELDRFARALEGWTAKGAF
jgi:hypothetical protein